MEELQKLFDVLTRDGYYTKSFEEFQNQFGTTEYQDKVFDVVSRDGLFTQDKTAFLNKYSVKKKTLPNLLFKKRNWYQVQKWFNLLDLRLVQR